MVTVTNPDIDTVSEWFQADPSQSDSTSNDYLNLINDMILNFGKAGAYGTDWSSVSLPSGASIAKSVIRINTDQNNEMRFYVYNSEKSEWENIAMGLQDYFIEVSRGNISGQKMFRGFGERNNIQVTVQGEDIWLGSATTVPTPADAGEDMFIVSSDNEDGAASQTGILTVQIHYLDASGNEQSIERTMNGTTPVAMTGLNIRFIQEVHVLTVGSNGVAVGNITIYKSGASSTIYSTIVIGGNQSLLTNRMVPLGKTLYITSWHGTVAGKIAQDQQVAIRLRSTDHEGVLAPGVFIFKDTMFLKISGMFVPVRVRIKIPALSIIKVSGWADVANAEASAYWEGVLIDD